MAGAAAARRRAALALAAALLALVAPARAQQQPDTAAGPASYHVLSFAFAPTGAASAGDGELRFAAGHALARGAGAAWLARLEAVTGLSFYGGTRDLGYLLGLEAAVLRAWTGDYLEFGVPVELYALAGGGLHAGWDLEQRRDERVVLPTAALGGGVRFRGAEQLSTFGLLWEHRFGGWPNRLYVRLDIHLPS